MANLTIHGIFSDNLNQCWETGKYYLPKKFNVHTYVHPFSGKLIFKRFLDVFQSITSLFKL